MASNTENVSIWWRHLFAPHVLVPYSADNNVVVIDTVIINDFKYGFTEHTALIKKETRYDEVLPRIIESIKTTSMEDVSTRVLEKIKNI